MRQGRFFQVFAFSSAPISPTMPRRNSRTQTTKITPVTTVTGSCGAGQIVLQRHDEEGADHRAEIVPMPPSSVISTTSPDICQ